MSLLMSSFSCRSAQRKWILFSVETVHRRVSYSLTSKLNLVIRELKLALLDFRRAISSGFISPINRNFLLFLDPPPSESAESFDWGEAALTAVEKWLREGSGGAQAFELDWKDAVEKKDVV